MRRPVLALPVAALCLALTAPATAQTAPRYDGDGEVLNVLPPGSRGNTGPAELAQLGVTNLPAFDPADPQGSLTTATGTAPTNAADQLEMYDALNRQDPATLPSDLSAWFKDAAIALDPADRVGEPVRPRPGVTIERDAAGVPYVTGETYEDVAYGSGYANIQDRMFLTDVLRHTGAARMSEFVGPTPANLAMDVAQLRIAAYTDEEAQAQPELAAARYGAEGERLLRGLDAMIQGMNDAQAALCPAGPVGPQCPVEYAALQKLPEDYDRADIVFIASLVGGIFGKGGGGEADNARWLQQLQDELGVEEGRRVFDDLREREDAEAPVTSPVPQPYEVVDGVDETQPGVALPDLGGPQGTGTGSPVAGSSPLPGLPSLPLAAGVVDGPFGPIDLGRGPRGMSNAVLVDAARGEDGHPTVVFGPQTGYFAPQLLVEQSLSGPGVQARGVSFAGTNLVVELGHGVDYAWSATSASGDNVDTVVERLCNADGSPATVDSTGYLVDGACTPMQSYVHSQTALPNLAAPGAPTQIDLLVLKTRHGVVQTRTTAGGAPVAVVLQRSTFGHEVDSVVGFSRLQDPGYVQDAASFQRAVEAIDFSFNWFYVDDRDISYFSSGLLPVRAEGVDGDLPRWGDTAYDWQGFLDFAGHPRVTNPGTGYLVSWNNKPAPGFRAADNSWGYGPVYRSLALEDRVRAEVAEGGVTRSELTGVMIDAATVDVRAAYLLPVVLDVLADEADPGVALLRAWVADGAHRVDRDRDGAYDEHAAAIALFDAWWDPQAALGVAGPSLPREVLRGTLGDLVDQLPQGLDDHPRLGQGSAFNGIAWYGYVSKDLRQVLGREVVDPYSRTYCGGGDPAACRADLAASLDAATAAALAARGVASVDALTYDKSQDSIRATAAGLVGVRPIDWQNRPTFQQVVSFSTHRPRAVAAAPGAPAGPSAGPGSGGGGTLAATGAPLLLPALVLLAGAGLVRRRARR